MSKMREEDIIDIIKVPRDRIAVIIGPKGTVKRKVEKETGVKLTIDSKEGEIEIIRSIDAEDPVLGLRAKDIIKAMARGFAPPKAFKLIDPNIYLEIISLTELVSDKSLERVKSRIIGREGKVRKNVAKLTETEMVIYGKTVSIIGDAAGVNTAKAAVLKLIQGAPHSAVFKFLEIKKQIKLV